RARAITDAAHSGLGRQRGVHCGPFSWRCLAGPGYGSWVDGLGAGLAGGVRFVLDGGQARRSENCDRAGSFGLVGIHTNEGAAGFSGPLLARGVACIWDLDCSGSCAALGAELKCRSCILPKAKSLANDDSI